MINETAQAQIMQYIEQGYDFSLNYDCEGKKWQADFNKWVGDISVNYHDGSHANINEAINIAFQNVKNNNHYELPTNY